MQKLYIRGLLFWGIVCPLAIQSFHIYEYATELFDIEPVPTEETVYQLFKKKPLDADVTYCAIPWVSILNKKKFDQIPNVFFERGGFTVCQHVNYLLILPHLKKMGVTVLFTPHVDKRHEHHGIAVLPFPHYPVNGADCTHEKELWYSFVGFDTHKSRRILFDLAVPHNAFIQERKHWHFARDTFMPNCVTKEEQAEEKWQYQKLLSRSRFSICPRGVGPSTIRFWESLQAGAIPVLIADAMELPDGVDWNNTIVRIAEKDTALLQSILEEISPEQEELMRRNCFAAYKQFSGDNFVSSIRLYYTS